MKKTVVKIVIVIFLLSFFTVPVWADSSEIDELRDNLSDEAKDIVDSWGYDPDDPGTFEIGSILEGVKDIFFSKITDPMKTLAVLLCIILILSIFNILSISEQADKLFEYVTSIIFASGLIVSFAEIISDTFEMLKMFMIFSTTLVSVYITVLLASGSVAAAGTFSGIVFFTSQGLSYLINYLFVPAIGGYTAISFSSLISNEDYISNVLRSIKNIFIFLIGLCVTIYSAVVTILGSINSSMDTVGQKTVSFISSSALPVVGKAVSEAVGAVFNSLSVIKSGVGIYGILGIVATILPTLIGLLLWRLAFVLLSAAAGGCSMNKISKCINALGDGIGIIISLVVVSSLIFIISLAMVK